MMKKLLSLALAMILVLCVFSGCGGQPEPAGLPEGAADNDILTFINNAENRPIIRIGTQYYTPDTGLVDALQEAFPDCLFVLDHAAAAGVRAEDRIMQCLDGSAYYDMIITGELKNIWGGEEKPLVDLSAEKFLDNYLLSALNAVSVDGHIYCIPGASTLTGVAFNVEMFEEHGWQIPRDTDEFFALCEEIKAAGISPFSTNFKYSSQVSRLLTMMCYPELFGTAEGAKWVADLALGRADFTGRMEPLYEIAQRFMDAGLITLEDFTASLTQQRQAFWAGEYAMIEYNSTIFDYAESEQAPFELGIMPYPTKEAEGAGFAVVPDYYISIPKYVEENPERLALMKEILVFLSSAEGQNAMLANSLRISNVKGIDLAGNPAAKYAEEAYERGNLYPLVDMAGTYSLLQSTVQTLLEGNSVEEAVALMDRSYEEALAAAEEEAVEEAPEVLATAETDFTMLETSYYIADKFREAAGTDLGVMINGGFFRANLADIHAGDITADLNPFIMKGVGAEDYLTTYKLTGAQIREAIEYPLVNDLEADVLVAASGLAIEYAPWNERGSRVLSLTIEDGTELADDQLYTVAAWAGVLPEQYITETVQVHEDLGAITDILGAAFRQDGSISPNIAGRVTLVWPEAE